MPIRSLQDDDTFDTVVSWLYGNEEEECVSGTSSADAREDDELVAHAPDERQPLRGVDPFLLNKWPPLVRKRSFAYKMPNAATRVIGGQIVYWIQAGDFEGFGPSGLYVDGNLCLQHCLWLSRALEMPVVAMYFVSKNSRRNIKAFLDKLLDMRIPSVGFECDKLSDIMSIFAIYTRKQKVYMIMTAESYMPHMISFFRRLGRAVPCPLYSVDSDCVLPPRYLSRDLDQDTHRILVEQARPKVLEEFKSYPRLQNCATSTEITIPKLVLQRFTCKYNFQCPPPPGQDYMSRMRNGELSGISCTAREYLLYKAYLYAKKKHKQETEAATLIVQEGGKYLIGDLVEGRSGEPCWNQAQKRLLTHGSFKNDEELLMWSERLFSWFGSPQVALYLASTYMSGFSADILTLTSFLGHPEGD
mmetsp:Transcript_23670/g.37779  ORF Transcript_23670/g.37779 Transcript_23670/m.37779 type:complete len:416 (+) Transcript_23670:3577-4824(+)